MRLLQRGALTHTHSDWRKLGEWFGTPGFVGVDDGGQVDGFLAVGADPLPAFWVRGCAFYSRMGMPIKLQNLIESTKPWMRKKGGEVLAWMPLQSWADPVLPKLGFELYAEVVTMVKDDLRLDVSLSSFSPNPNIVIRPVQPADFPQLEAIEALAFEPLWRFSAEGLALAQQETCYFEVAELNGRVMGYQCSTSGLSGAHLARMTVHPEAHGQGVGSALMFSALAGYRRSGAMSASLNTQIDNRQSQRLYEKFGYYLTREMVPVWVLNL
jgi:ribosomal protein S18 acetylase RimI-like enzyme